MAKKANKTASKKDERRIEAIALLIERDYIKTWRGLFEYIPRTVVATHLGLNDNSMKKYIELPSIIPCEKLEQMALFLKVKLSVLEELAQKEKIANKAL